MRFLFIQLDGNIEKTIDGLLGIVDQTKKMRKVNKAEDFDMFGERIAPRPRFQSAHVNLFKGRTQKYGQIHQEEGDAELQETISNNFIQI